MSIQYRDNSLAVGEWFMRKSMQITTAMQNGIVRGLREFESKHIQPSMRGKGPRSINASPMTKASWRVTSRGFGESFVARLATSRWYLGTHAWAWKGFRGIIRAKRAPFLVFQIGRRWIRTKKVRIPKRLYIKEDYRRYGGRIIRDHMRREIKRTLSYA